MRRLLLLSVLILAVAPALSACSDDQTAPESSPAPTATAVPEATDQTPGYATFRDTPATIPAASDATHTSRAAETLTDPLADFGLALLAREAQATDGNVVISPASIHAVLAMVLNGAEAETAAEMRQALGLDGMDAEAVNQGWADMIAIAHTGKNAQIRFADSIWVREGVRVRPEFVRVNRDHFAASTEGLTDDPIQAAADINEWVEERTGGRIDNLLDEVPPEVALVLVNTLYVKAGWTIFDAAATQPGPFTLGDGQRIQVPMMHGRTWGQATSTREYDAVALQSDGYGQVTVWVIVPKGDGTPESLVEILGERGLHSVTSSQASAQVDIVMPRFRLEYTTDDALKTSLADLGMRRAFSPDLAQFGGMADVRPLWIDKIVHKAVFDVNEEGVEAAAATAVEAAGGLGPPPEHMSVTVDRPFLVALTQTHTQAPLFLAIVRDPR